MFSKHQYSGFRMAYKVNGEDGFKKLDIQDEADKKIYFFLPFGKHFIIPFYHSYHYYYYQDKINFDCI